MREDRREPLPDPVVVPLSEVGAVISALDRLLHMVEVRGQREFARVLDEVIGRMTRWVWPLLDELDDDEGYDE